MKTLFSFILFIVILIAAPIPASSSKNLSLKQPITVTVKKKTTQVLDVLTIYNPSKRQCDSSPLITANNARIDVNKLYRQEVRWMALSRDLLKRWNGAFHYGDTVTVNAGDPAIDGVWVIQDTLNKRYKNRGDLLFDSRVRTLGKWENVEITKYETEEVEMLQDEYEQFLLQEALAKI